ncbi:amidase [Myxosarcina sp. GI1(2024)]
MSFPEYSITQLQTAYKKDTLSVVGVCQEFLERIACLDSAGPKLRSVVEVNPDALAIAASLDDERKKKQMRGLMHGIPVLLKDSIDTNDRMVTTGGSLALINNRAPLDAFIVQKLRNAGAVILGKTNMSEWGYMRSTRACSGWSSRGGQTRNPYVLDRSPLGSSSGSAVAVSANLCTIAIGAEVDGSIVRPASSNGVVGLKPTVGLISRSGIIGVASTQDTAGPMARCVEDIAIVLNFLTGFDRDDPVTAESEGYTFVDYRKCLDPNALQGARLGVARERFGQHEGSDGIIEKAIEILRDLGATIVDPIESSILPFFGQLELELFLYGIKANLNHYLATHPQAGVRSLDELIQFNREHAAQVMPFFQQEFFELAAEKGNLNDGRYQELVGELRRLSRTDGIDKALREHKLDAIIAPTEGSPPFSIDVVVGDNLKPGGASTPPAVAGYPHLTVPAGFIHNLPIGLSFYSNAYQEPKLLSYAYAFEQATKARQVPTYLSTISGIAE